MQNVTFCDVLHEENKSRKQTLESAHYGLEISFKILFEFSVLNLTAKMSNETRFSTVMQFINSP